MNRSETAQLLQRITERWPAWRLPTGEHLVSLIATWAGDLTHVPLSAATEAVRAASLDGREWPPPLGWVVVEGLRRSGVPMPPDPDEAWLEVQRQMSAVGWYGSPVWSHPAVGDVVRELGGFKSLCVSENAMSDRAHFLRLYPAARQRAVVAACERPVPLERSALPPTSSHHLLEPPAAVVELDAAPVMPAPRRASPEEAAAARQALAVTVRAASPHPNHKRARSDP